MPRESAANLTRKLLKALLFVPEDSLSAAWQKGGEMPYGSLYHHQNL